jgi:hypothetical protein
MVLEKLDTHSQKTGVLSSSLTLDKNLKMYWRSKYKAHQCETSKENIRELPGRLVHAMICWQDLQKCRKQKQKLTNGIIAN